MQWVSPTHRVPGSRAVEKASPVRVPLSPLAGVSHPWLASLYVCKCARGEVDVVMMIKPSYLLNAGGGGSQCGRSQLRPPPSEAVPAGFSCQ